MCNITLFIEVQKDLVGLFCRGLEEVRPVLGQSGDSRMNGSKFKRASD